MIFFRKPVATFRDHALGPHHRTVRLRPGAEPALDVAGRRQAGVLGGLRGHRRALAEGAVEHEAPAGRGGELVQHAARAHVVLKIEVGRVQRAGDQAVLLALARLAPGDHHPTPPRGGPRSPPRALAATAQPRRAISPGTMPICMFAGTATSIILGLGRWRLLIRSTYSSTERTWSRGLNAFSSPMVETVSPL